MSTDVPMRNSQTIKAEVESALNGLASDDFQKLVRENVRERIVKSYDFATKDEYFKKIWLGDMINRQENCMQKLAGEVNLDEGETFDVVRGSLKELRYMIKKFDLVLTRGEKAIEEILHEENVEKQANKKK